jgi:hypothetical protein
MKKIIMAEFNEFNSTFKLGDHHYAKQFAQNGYEVLWLSPVYNHLFYFKNKKLYKQRESLHNNSFIKFDDNIYGYAPYSPVLYGKMPILDSKVAGELSIKWSIPNLFNVLNKNRFLNVDILWLTNPKYYYLTNKIKYKKMFYRCADDLSGFDNTFNSFHKFEEKIIKNSDEVFITSRELLERKKYLRDDFVYLPNGVDINSFTKKEYILPDEFLNDKNKKCIYVGAIETWFDIKLVKFCAEKLSNISFYIIGPIKINIDELRSLKNVFLLGKKDYKDIPNYIYFSDVGVIPFKVSKLTDSVSPIKLYEYMSVGLNVVSTNFKEMQYINSPAYVAKDYDEFCSDIEQAIENKKEDKEKNIQFAKENTWGKRFEVIKSFI